ncbi:cysteine-tRNA ligase [Phytophthora nicotianae INRA-310]|uniref:cysteine--tRNA ligase n=1 Tax=Phytophthora nicotianae (strain INRA-310) TaxID=761204 RepID=W2R5L8_PHYN3|nr:cysteine-tRNA ligase [Phytophthora nicotianae INRA-310]ETN20556.1 cysteine-tRNA ligase [Phytophthora nicotianae INRA-310]
MRMLHRLPAVGCSPRAFCSLLPPRWLSTSSYSSSPTCRDLKMFNALTGQCEPFPRETSATPNVLKWYACGPTVYDRAHLGHARAYVSQDILRRVAERTGGYNVQLVMGVTDVDDKIIKRAKEKNVSFETLAREQEQQFFADMTKLYVKPPTAITRVSEHLPEIIKYIKEIQNKGFAYEAVDGSGVYFNTQQLGDKYGKLDPRRQTQQDEQLLAAVEQSDVVEEEEKVKKDPRDFALWKAAKEPDEPAWPSPWGMGRPGWHIECSAMTHHVLGDKLDVHTGGVDLRFPHHNNEIAQCEAHNHQQCNHDEEWCKHFVHFGHLYIRGRKMSKSLKNFISVRDFLQDGHTADHFRLFCLQFKYRANLVYSEDRVRDAEAVADRLRGFFRSVTAYGDHEISSSGHTQHIKSKRCEQLDLELLDALFATRAQVDAALLDDLDTPRALSLVLELVSRGNTYLLASRGDTEAPDEVLMSLTDYVLDVLDLFGLEGLHAEFSTMMRRRFTSRHSETQHKVEESDELVSRDDHEALLRSLLKFRASVREEALRDPKQPGNARVLSLCDDLRNKELPQLGIQVEDLSPGRSVFKLLSRTERKAETEDTKTTATHTLKQKQQEFDALMQISPSEFFKNAPEFTGRFNTFDADGFPTHEHGEPLTKSQRKKLAKKLAKHEKSYAKYWQTRKEVQ